MDFLKKHYEKILLSFVLLGLVGVLLLMTLIIPSRQEKIREIGVGIISGHAVALPNPDLTRQSNVIERLQSPYRLDFDSPNKLFNPVEWRRAADGTLKKAAGFSPSAAVVTGITPLYLILTLDSVETNELGARYVISVERQAASNLALRRKQQRYVSMDDPKKDVFTLVQVKGPPDNPDALTLKLADDGQTISLSKDKPFRRVDAYAADLKFDPEKGNWSGQRVGSVLRLAGENYTIVDISSNEVILSAQSNQKKWTLRYTP